MLNVKTIGAAVVGAAAIGLSVGSVAPADAAILSGSISGTVTSTSGVVPGVSVNNPVTGSYSYDDSVVVGNINPFTAFNLSIGANSRSFTLADIQPGTFGRDTTRSIPAQDSLIFFFNDSALADFFGLTPLFFNAQGSASAPPAPSVFFASASSADGGGSFSLSYTATPTPIPTPALLPGLLGMGIAAWRKRKGEQIEQGAEMAEV